MVVLLSAPKRGGATALGPQRPWPAWPGPVGQSTASTQSDAAPKKGGKPEGRDQRKLQHRSTGDAMLMPRRAMMTVDVRRQSRKNGHPKRMPMYKSD